VLERHRQHAGVDVVAVGAVVVAAHPDPVPLQVANAYVEGLGPRLGDLPPEPITTTRREQRDALGAREAVVKRLHALVDPLAAMLPRSVEPLPVQLVGIDIEDLAAQPLHRLDLHPPAPAGPAGCLDGAHVILERLRRGELLHVLDAALDRPGLEGLQQRSGGQLGARVGAPQRRTPHFARCRVEALEHRPHLLGGGDPLQAALGGSGADEAAWGLSAAGEVLLAVAGDLVQPVGLLTRLQRLHRQRHPGLTSRPRQAGSRASQMRMC
jgi:hypothetical protein